MFKIAKYSKIISREIDYVIVNEDNEDEVICLFKNDWNGELYTNSTIYDKNTGIYDNIDKRFKPIYKEVGEDEFEVIGFEELF